MGVQYRIYAFCLKIDPLKFPLMLGKSLAATYEYFFK